MTSFGTLSPADRAAQLRAALRLHAGAWISRLYRHEILTARTIRGFQAEAVDLFRRDVIAPIVQRVAAGLATFEQRGNDVLADANPQLRAIVSDVEGIVARGVRAVQHRHDGNLRDLVRHETEWVADTTRKTLKVDVPMVSPDASFRAVQQRPYLGGRVDEWFATLIGGDNGAADNVRAVIRTGIAAGWTNDEMVRALRGHARTGYTDGLLSGQNVAQVRALVQSSAAHAASTARIEEFKAIGFTQYRWLATLDTKVCVACARREAESPYDFGMGPVPPAHPNCRCAVNLWFGEPEGTRASSGGHVPAETTVEQWLEGQPVGAQNDMLGPTRAAAWRKGRLTFDQMVGVDMEPLTVGELRRLDRLPDADEPG